MGEGLGGFLRWEWESGGRARKKRRDAKEGNK